MAPRSPAPARHGLLPPSCQLARWHDAVHERQARSHNGDGVTRRTHETCLRLFVLESRSRGRGDQPRADAPSEAAVLTPWQLDASSRKDSGSPASPRGGRGGVPPYPGPVLLRPQPPQRGGTGTREAAEHPRVRETRGNPLWAFSLRKSWSCRPTRSRPPPALPLGAQVPARARLRGRVPPAPAQRLQRGPSGPVWGTVRRPLPRARDLAPRRLLEAAGLLRSPRARRERLREEHHCCLDWACGTQRRTDLPRPSPCGNILDLSRRQRKRAW